MACTCTVKVGMVSVTSTSAIKAVKANIQARWIILATVKTL